MQPKIGEAERTRQRVKDAKLTSQYRPIGPAAIVAALICAAKKAEQATDGRQQETREAA